MLLQTFTNVKGGLADTHKGQKSKKERLWISTNTKKAKSERLWIPTNTKKAKSERLWIPTNTKK
ncbi:MAG: hypothetical protein MI866_15135, partial [Bacteroidales bacterium]|nr:hypothetical protein [Bacteroidales bacterium]